MYIHLLFPDVKWSNAPRARRFERCQSANSSIASRMQCDDEMPEIEGRKLSPAQPLAQRGKPFPLVPGRFSDRNERDLLQVRVLFIFVGTAVRRRDLLDGSLCGQR